MYIHVDEQGRVQNQKCANISDEFLSAGLRSLNIGHAFTVAPTLQLTVSFTNTRYLRIKLIFRRAQQNFESAVAVGMNYCSLLASPKSQHSLCTLITHSR